MNLSVRFLPEARQDVTDSRDWYEQQQEGLGALFSVALVDAVERIQVHPYRFPEVQGPIRRVILQRFPHTIYFPNGSHGNHCSGSPWSPGSQPMAGTGLNKSCRSTRLPATADRSVPLHQAGRGH